MSFSTGLGSSQPREASAASGSFAGRRRLTGDRYVLGPDLA